MNTGGLIIGLLIGGLSLLCIICLVIWKKGKQSGYEQGKKDYLADCDKRLMQFHNDVTAGTEPFSVSETDTKWGRVSEPGTTVRMESHEGDGNK